jgi:hypothetical protein
MPKTKNILWDAERLALFSNASTAGEIQQFRENREDFFPRNFWNWPLRVGGPGEFAVSSVPIPQEVIPFWQAFQRALRDAWQVGFPLEECVRLISSAAVPDRLFGKTDVEPDLLSYPVWPYQRAVMFLGVEPWRARFCGQCGKRFVADKPARRFCSNTCSAKARKASRMDWWNRKGEEWRTKKNVRGKGTRRTKR